MKSNNLDKDTVESFSAEWHEFDQRDNYFSEAKEVFDKYFSIFPWEILPKDPEGFDMGCGTGRWAKFISPNVSVLNCIDPSNAINVAKSNLRDCKNVSFFQESVDSCSLAPASQDFGYSLGVLHHIPDTKSAIKSCAALLKPGAPFLIYLYYDFENKNIFFKMIWKISDVIRKIISKIPNSYKKLVTDFLALIIYLPLSRISLVLKLLKLPYKFMPLSFYHDKTFYTMRTDSRDRFGTPLEQRFSKRDITLMLTEAGFKDVRFSNQEPYWCAVAVKVDK